jgi:diacylglycerol kinase family enzyme
MFIAPDAELDDGQLDIVMTGRKPRRRALLDLPKLFTGEHVHTPAVKVVRAREVRVSADRPFTIYADGDPIAELPATVGLRHRALRVLAPAG